MRWILFAGAALVCLIAVMTLIGAMLPRAHHVTRMVHLNAMPEAICALIEGSTEWRSDIGASGKISGTTWWEQNKRGRRVTYELVESHPPLKRVIRVADKSLPFGGAWTVEILPDGEGATVRMTEEGEIYNPLFRFAARFVFGYEGTIDTYLRDLQNAQKAGMLSHSRPLR